MRICLVRHAIAADRGTAGYEDDALRPLTDRGRQRMEEAAAGLQVLFTPQVILSSPLVRARETAEILLARYSLPKVRFSEALAGGDHAKLLATIEETEADEVICVGHEPHMSAMLSWVLTGDESAVSAVFKKGAAALVSSSRGARAGEFVLEWLIQPAGLREIGSHGS